jgi:hypothetical protein
VEDGSGDCGVDGMRNSQSAYEVNIIRGIKAGHKPTFHLLANGRRRMTMQHSTNDRGRHPRVQKRAYTGYHLSICSSCVIRGCDVAKSPPTSEARAQSITEAENALRLVWLPQRRGSNRAFLRFDPAA